MVDKVHDTVDAVGHTVGPSTFTVVVDNLPCTEPKYWPAAVADQQLIGNGYQWLIIRFQ